MHGSKYQRPEKVEVFLNLQTQLSPIPLTPFWKHPPSFLTSHRPFPGPFLLFEIAGLVEGRGNGLALITISDCS